MHRDFAPIEGAPGVTTTFLQAKGKKISPKITEFTNNMIDQVLANVPHVWHWTMQLSNPSFYIWQSLNLIWNTVFQCIEAHCFIPSQLAE